MAGFANDVFNNDIVYADNVDFSGALIPTRNITLDGQLLIGSSVAPNIRPGTLTAGTGIAITTGHGTISISSTGSEMSWTDEGVNFNAVAGNGYFSTAVVTATLPGAPSQGNRISFIVDSASALTITANAGQVIRLGNTVSAVAGTAVNTQRGDSINLVFRFSDSAWIATSSIGAWTIT